MDKLNIFLTSVGVMTGVNVISALKEINDYKINIVGADLNALSAGLHLVDKPYIVPRIDSPEYINCILKICQRENIDLIIPLFSKEIKLFSTHMSLFHKNNIPLFVPESHIVDLCDDKVLFVKFLRKNNFPYPKTYFDAEESLSKIEYPCFIKLRRGSGSKDSMIVNDKSMLKIILRDRNEYIVQTYLSGKEFTIDMVLSPIQEILGIVVRERIETKAGMSVKGVTVLNENIKSMAIELAKKLRLVGPCNIQFKKDKKGEIKVLEVNPRFSAGGLPLTVCAGVNLPKKLVLLSKNIVEKQLEYKIGLYMTRYFSEVFYEETKLEKFSRIL